MLSKEHFQILVVGGSQGARRLNRIFLDTLERLSPEEKQKIAVTHITGKLDFESIKTSYGVLGIVHDIHPFFEDMPQLYQKEDLAVTRAGANTLFELALFGLPGIVIPYPHAGAHQKACHAIVIVDYGQTLGWPTVAKTLELLLVGQRHASAVKKFIVVGLSINKPGENVVHDGSVHTGSFRRQFAHRST